MPEKTDTTNNPKKKELNKRQKAFVTNYLLLGNASESAIRAGYSKACAKQIGQKLLTNIYVSAEISRLHKINEKKLEEKFNITSEMILARLAKIAFSDLKDMIEPEQLENIKLKDSAGLKSIKIARGFDNITLTAHDTVKALQLLGESIGLFGEKQKNDGEESNRKAIEARVLELAEKFDKTGTI